METLRAENLIKTFKISEKQRKALDIGERKKVAVKGISFTAYSGEVFGLLGPNGAGKTTTMRMLATLIKPDNGDVFYNDKSVVKNSTDIRSEFAFLTTDLKLDVKSTANDACIPAWNTMIVMQDIIACDYSFVFASITCVVNLFFVVVAIFITGRLFENEKIING